MNPRASDIAAARARRRRAMIRAYTAPGANGREVADKFGISINTLYVNMHRWGVTLDADERSERLALAARSTWKGRARKTRGRPSAWPDCPAHLLPDYHNMVYRKNYRAAEARAILESQQR